MSGVMAMSVAMDHGGQSRLQWAKDAVALAGRLQDEDVVLWCLELDLLGTVEPMVR